MMTTIGTKIMMPIRKDVKIPEEIHVLEILETIQEAKIPAMMIIGNSNQVKKNWTKKKKNACLKWT